MMCNIRIKEIRKVKGISQKDLASKTGFSQAKVSRKENGVTATTVQDLRLFAAALGVSVSELLGEKQPKAAGGQV
ncbi:MAG: helix-turn-helix domain-containing protein [Peptococcaceae bacterium]|nr:helix-turn-helix domain-containing protein [Peptococcaceae bacterium]